MTEPEKQTSGGVEHRRENDIVDGAKSGSSNPQATASGLALGLALNVAIHDGYYYYYLAVYGVMPSNQCLAASEAAARKAVELDPKLSEVHAALGFALSGRFNWAEGERHFRRALELNQTARWRIFDMGVNSLSKATLKKVFNTPGGALNLIPSRLSINSVLVGACTSPAVLTNHWNNIEGWLRRSPSIPWPISAWAGSRGPPDGMTKL
ncbi:MAG: hypothetical protein WAQ99_07860 [Pyrinomonadaceae bacterium]